MKFLLLAGYAESLLNFRGPLISALLNARIEVHVGAPFMGHDQSIREHLQAKGVHVHNIRMNRTGLSPAADLWTLLDLFRLLRNVRPDYFFAYTVKPVIYGSLLAWLVGVPRRYALITGLGYAFQGQLGERRALKRIVLLLYQITLSKTTKVFFQNPDDQILFASLGLLKEPGSSVVVNGSGVDVDKFLVAPFPLVPRFLLIARLLGDKGVREYVRAAAVVKLKYPATEFVLVGWIDENPDAIKQHELDGWVVEGIVKFLGRVTDVRQVIKDCSVYVLPSYREGTPRTVLEAMSMGRPIITTDAPGCRETVIHGKNGLLIPAHSVDELAEAMCWFIENPVEAQKMGACSRELAESKYDVHKVNKHMLTEMEIK